MLAASVVVKNIHGNLKPLLEQILEVHDMNILNLVS
jgi:hypothetical protein